MATQLAPFGLRPSKSRLGLAPNYKLTQRRIKSGYATAIGFGDLVALGSSGNAGYVTRYAANGTHVLGVFAGLAPFFDTSLQQIIGGRRNYLGTENPTGDITCFIIDDPDAVFEIQVSGGPVTIANIGQNADVVVGSPDSTGISGTALDYSTVANTATLPLRIMGISEFARFGINPTNDATFSSPAANNLVEVSLNTSELRSTTGL